MLHLLLVIHNHQPLGNLPEVFRKAWEMAYKPFIDVIRKHPKINWALHVSGPLWEWLETQEPGYLDILKQEHAAGRLEFLTGAMWEPIQPLIDEHSCRLHLSDMRSFLADRFDVEPVGSWTTERVWEPNLAGRLAQAGIRYTLLDDSQLRAGLPSPSEGHQVWGYYRTEHNGSSIAIFPIDEQLRYLIPFARSEEVIDYLEQRARTLPDNASITYGDDGEKFGLWPNTYKWVYEEKWLDKFFGLLEQSSSIVTTHPSKYLQIQPHPRQRVYVPTSSYREMGIWTLYPQRNLAAEDIHKWVESNPYLKEIGPPHAAGLFRNFLSRYPESRFMHERAGELLRQVLSGPDGAELYPSNAPDASPKQRALWHVLRAQCNCAYWHGVFGGLYLNYLRFALHREVLTAEKILADNGISTPNIRHIGTGHPVGQPGSGGFEPDTESEILIAGSKVHWTIDPVTAQIISAGSLDRAVDVIDVLARRYEAYHATMKELSAKPSAGSPASIHDMQEYAPLGWRDGHGYDRCRRGCFGDRIIAVAPNIDSLARVDYKAEIDLERNPWIVEMSQDQIALKRADGVWNREKHFTFDNQSSTARMKYRLIKSDNSSYFGQLLIEFNVGLLAGDAPDRYHLLSDGEHRSLASGFTLDKTSGTSLVDEWTGVVVHLEVKGADWMGVYSVKTLSRSEGGLEMTYQGSAIVFRVPVAINIGGVFECDASMAVENKV